MNKSNCWTVGRKTLVYSFDDVNGQGVARLYKRGEFCLTLKEWRSPLMMPNLAACKGQYLDIKGPQYFGNGFIKEAFEVMGM